MPISWFYLLDFKLLGVFATKKRNFLCMLSNANLLPKEYRFLDVYRICAMRGSQSWSDGSRPWAVSWRELRCRSVPRLLLGLPPSFGGSLGETFPSGNLPSVNQNETFPPASRLQLAAPPLSMALFDCIVHAMF